MTALRPKVFLTLAYYTLFVSLIILLRWNSLSMPFERDEGEYAYGAQIMSQGKLPYQDTFLQKPPLIIYTYRFAQLLDPFALWPPRLLAILFIAATALVVGRISSNLYGRVAGFIAPLLFLPMISLPHFTALAANTEVFLILPATLTLWFALKEDKATRIDWFISGITSTLTLLFKPIALPMVVIMYIYWLRHSKKPDILSHLLAACCSALLTLSLSFLPIIRSGTWSMFWEEVVTFNQAYAAAFPSTFFYLARYLKILFFTWPLLALLAIASPLIRPKKWLLHLLLIGVSLASFYRTPIHHYYLIIMPFLAILVTGSLTSTLNRLTVSPTMRPNRPYLLVLSTFLILLSLLVAVSKQFTLSPTQLSLWIYGTENPFVESRLMAEKLAAITQPSDPVFIGGSEPQILYYSRRFSPTRFIITYPLNLATPYAYPYQREVVEDLKQTPPAAIVISQMKNSGLVGEQDSQQFTGYLESLLASSYTLVGGTFWDSGQLIWKHPPTAEEQKEASLLLYKRL